MIGRLISLFEEKPWGAFILFLFWVTVTICSLPFLDQASRAFRFLASGRVEVTIACVDSEVTDGTCTHPGQELRTEDRMRVCRCRRPVPTVAVPAEVSP